MCVYGLEMRKELELRGLSASLVRPAPLISMHFHLSRDHRYVARGEPIFFCLLCYAAVLEKGTYYAQHLCLLCLIFSIMLNKIFKFCND